MASPALAPIFWRRHAQIQTQDITATGTNATIVVQYADETGLSYSSIDATDLTVTAPDGKTILNVTLLSAVPDDGGTPHSVRATYGVEAPGGSWDAGDNGTYTVKLDVGAATDTSNNPVAEQTLTFKADLPASPPPVSPPPVHRRLSLPHRCRRLRFHRPQCRRHPCRLLRRQQM